MERCLIKEMCMENIQPQSMIWFKSMVYVKFLAKQENTEMVQVNRQTILNGCFEDLRRFSDLSAILRVGSRR